MAEITETTQIRITIPYRNKLNKLADHEGRMQIKMLELLIDEAFKKLEKVQ